MPRERLRTSRRASAVEAYGWKRVPPRAGPRAVEWIAMMALRPVPGSWAKTTCSCSDPSSKTSDMDGPAFVCRRRGWCVAVVDQRRPRDVGGVRRGQGAGLAHREVVRREALPPLVAGEHPPGAVEVR